MTIDPRSQDEVQQDLKQSLQGRITKLTNFIENSVNRVLLTAFGNELHEIEAKVLAAQLSGFVEYAGDTNLDESDFDALNVDGVTPAEVNQFMDDSQLDELAKIVGVSRDAGTPATGEVVVQTATDETQIPDGMEVATSGGVDDDSLIYEVTLDQDSVTPDPGQTSVTVPITATAVGPEFNVGPNTINFFPSPPVGVEGVTNPTAVEGGVGRQDNASLRNDVKNAVFETSGGGTARGVEGKVKSDVAGIQSIVVDEFPNQSPPFVDVIVDGGSASEVRTAIDQARPVGVRHNLIRPDVVSIGTTVELLGSSASQSLIEDEIVSFLSQLSLNEDVRRSVFQQAILNTDDSIRDIGAFALPIQTVTDETQTYVSGTNVYELEFAPFGRVQSDERLYRTEQNVYGLLFDKINATSVTVEATVDGVQQELVRGTDYTVVDTDGDTNLDGLDFSVGGVDPDDRTTVEVEYTHDAVGTTSTITDENGTTYAQGTDWQVVDNDGDGRLDSIDWSVGGTAPSGGTQFQVTYSPGRTVVNDQPIGNRQKASVGSNVTVNIFEE